MPARKVQRMLHPYMVNQSSTSIFGFSLIEYLACFECLADEWPVTHLHEFLGGIS